ncbi:transposase [Planctomycetota bacterium]
MQTTEVGGEERGYDSGTKKAGRKRHIAVDTIGLLLTVVVHGAYWQDQDGACFVFMKQKQAFRRLQVVFGDSAYGRSGLPEWVKATCGLILQAVLLPVNVKGFVVLPKRWIVERTFAWINRCRRNSKDYERTTESSTAMIQITMIKIMLRRIEANA